MKITKWLLGVVTLFVLTLGLAFYVNLGFADNSSCDTASVSCGKCGDGFCNRRCGETATSCPRDCGVSSLGE